jgi:cytochrome c oxidase subunit IV
MSEHIVPKKTYFAIFAALVILTATTVFVATIDLGPMNIVAALVIAACKATLVLLFFMHVRYSPRIIGLILFAGLLWLVLLIALTLTDYLTRSWIPGPRGL